jgi:hypothetical protein
MRILFASEYKFVETYEGPLTVGFECHGCEVVPFVTRDYLDQDFSSKVQRKLLFGPRLSRMNRGLIEAVDRVQPEVVFLFRPVYFTGSTARELKRRHPNLCLVNYTNDNAFEDGEEFAVWRRHFDFVPWCDLNYYYRAWNVDAAKARGIPNPKLTMPHYVEGIHRPCDDVPDQFKSEVLYAGHWEDDGRIELFEFLLAHGLPLTIRGFSNCPPNSPLIPALKPTLRGLDYARALAGAKIVLGVVSARNKDKYTRRTFEIPACGSLMLAPRNDVIETMFRDGVEAVYYTDHQDCLDRARYYLEHESERARIARAGYERCLRDGHSNIARCQAIVQDIKAILPTCRTAGA